MNPSPERVHDEGHFKVSVEYVLTGVASWLIPGAGHFWLGYRLRGAILAVGIIGLFWFGESALGGNMAVSREVSPIFYYCQAGNGLSAIVAEYQWGKPRYANKPGRPDYDIPRYYNFGVLFTTVSGLLNLLAVLHVLDPHTWRKAKARRTEGRHLSGAGLEEAAPQRGGKT